MLLTEYDEVATMELFKEEGRTEGALGMLVNLVKKGRMTPAEAAEEASMTVAEFEKHAAMLPV